MVRTNTNELAGSPFAWTGKKNKAAALVADDFLTDREIAKKIKVSVSALEDWKRHPAFKARLSEIAKTLEDASRQFAIARRIRRIAALDSRWHKMHAIIDARAVAPEMQAAPGGNTGLLVRTEKQIGSGENARVVEEFAVDTGLLKMLREHEKQAAQEMGQWGAKEGADDNVNALIAAELERIARESREVTIYLPDNGRQSADFAAERNGHAATSARQAVLTP